MTVRRSKEPGGRKIRHVVVVSDEEHNRLLEMAISHGWSIPKLLMESTLKNKTAITSLSKQVTELRRELSELNRDGDLDRFEKSWQDTHSKLMDLLEK
jgi:hypothetical protein